MAMSKQDFVKMAHWIRLMAAGNSKDAVFKFALHIATDSNPNFDHKKFFNACYPDKNRESIKEIEREGLRAGGIKLISLAPLREEK